MLDGLAQPLPQPEEHPGQLVVRLGQQLRVAVGVLDRLAQERLRGAQVVVVAAHQRELHEGAGASGAVPGPAEHLLEHLARPAAVARLERAGGGVRDPAPDLGGLIRRREVRRPLEQLGRRRRRAARLGSAAGVVERARDGLVRAGRGEREVPRALLGLAHPLGDRGVQGASRRRIRRGVGARGEQRVGEARRRRRGRRRSAPSSASASASPPATAFTIGQGRLAHRRRHREAAAGGG